MQQRRITFKQESLSQSLNDLENHNYWAMLPIYGAYRQNEIDRNRLRESDEKFENALKVYAEQGILVVYDTIQLFAPSFHAANRYNDNNLNNTIHSQKEKGLAEIHEHCFTTIEKINKRNREIMNAFISNDFSQVNVRELIH